MKNILERASRISNRDRAVRLVADALRFQTEGHTFSDPERWKKLAPWSRLMEIKTMLDAECTRAMRLTPGPDPRDTVGTRD